MHYARLHSAIYSIQAKAAAQAAQANQARLQSILQDIAAAAEAAHYAGTKKWKENWNNSSY